MKQHIPGYILPVIVFAQFTGTSLWFAGNAVVDDLIAAYSLPELYLGYITMSVQAGFIAGTFIFAIQNVADRYSPVAVFLVCALLGAGANGLVTIAGSGLSIITARFFTGFFLSGIYPVGMKIASDWHKEGLGRALGYLVGALVVGTAFPHFLKFAGGDLPWRYVITGTSLIAGGGGLLLFVTVPDGPYRTSTPGFTFGVNGIRKLFKNKDFRSASCGYFGHMWELYTFWAFVPVMLTLFISQHPNSEISIPLWSFIIIAIGGVSCVMGGYFSLSKGSKWVSLAALAGSGISCLLLPLSFELPEALFLILLLTWGFFVAPDSPQFSTLIAQSSDSALQATGLTIVNSIGFALTICSIQLVNLLFTHMESPYIFWALLPGPLFGLWTLSSFGEKSS
ncbi:MAG: MFS transporter [Bacteroidetes bacterium]|jgi:MFS family permease|nr:MFS transporter [Bacteroidota bacterium]